MVGGYVIETVLKDNGKIWINCQSNYSSNQTCAVYVPESEEAYLISPGDSIWWQGGSVYWTAKKTSDPDSETVGRKEVELKKKSGSGVSRPPEDRIEKVLCKI
jgi:hypothetical protein